MNLYFNKALPVWPEGLEKEMNITDQASCNHGFASYAALLILEAEGCLTSGK